MPNIIRYGNKCPPVLLLTFSRPEKAAAVLERIRGARPNLLYVACDGPRPGREDDLVNVRTIHEMVSRIDWCPDVKTLYRDTNLGCGRAVSQAITWFMNNAGEGIILEDDCLPDPTFFPFCAEMLDRYRDVSNVMQVAGYNKLSGRYDPGEDYLFSQFGWQWGWATWKRAWDRFDLAMANWPLFKKYGFHRFYPFYGPSVEAFECTYGGEIDTWDYQWHFAYRSNSGLSVVPRYSLIENIGFGAGATHGTDVNIKDHFKVPVKPMSFPIQHSTFLYPDPYYDRMLKKTTEPQTLRGKLSYFARSVYKNYLKNVFDIKNKYAQR